MEVIHVRDDEESWKKAGEIIKEKRPFKVAVQAPARFQPFVNQLISNAISWDEFVDAIRTRTGKEKHNWFHVVKACDAIAANTYLIEPDIDEVLEEIKPKLKIEEKNKIIQEARLWYLSRSGFSRKITTYLLTIFIFLPHFLRIWVAKAIMKIYAIIANIIPGDQHDVLVAVSLADDVIAMRMAQRIKEKEPDMVVLHEWYAEEVMQRYAEL